MKDRFDLGPQPASTIFIGKWTVKILYLLREHPHRHGQLRRRLGNISQRMLTRTVRNLESGGLISRQGTQSNTVAVEYALTRLGKTFIVPLGSLCRWADQHGKALSATVRLSGAQRRIESLDVAASLRRQRSRALTGEN